MAQGWHPLWKGGDLLQASEGWQDAPLVKGSAVGAWRPHQGLLTADVCNFSNYKKAKETVFTS